MKCEICNENNSKKVISDINMCSDCFDKISKLRTGNQEAYNYFNNSGILSNCSNKVKSYIDEYMKIYEANDAENKKKLAKQEEAIRIENYKQNFANSFGEYYEYDVVTIVNTYDGSVNKDSIKKILNDYASKGWKLHTVYSNELDKNAVSLLGIKINETASEDVLIFERRIQNYDK